MTESCRKLLLITPMINFSSQRLNFRALQRHDLAFYLALNRDPQVMGYSGGVRTQQQLNQYFEHTLVKMAQVSPTYYCWVIECHSDQEPLGLAFLMKNTSIAEHAEIGLLLSSQSQDQGYGFETKVALLNYSCYTLELQRLYSSYEAHNIAMVRINNKLGFITEREQQGQVSGYVDLANRKILN